MNNIIVAFGVAILIGVFGFYFYSGLKGPQSLAQFKDVKITLERTPCFGTCPAYKLTIRNNGDVLYEGKEYVYATGARIGQISQVELRELVDKFYRIEYFSLEDEYTAPISDLPTTITSITIDGKTKKVINYYGAPDNLKDLENEIDRVTSSNIWVGKKGII